MSVPCERARRRFPAGGPSFDLVAAKTLAPLVRPGTVRRSSLIDRLARGDPHPVVSVVAPAGYGKTTLLSQWAEHSSQAFAWVSVDEADNDPKVLLTYIAEALDAIEPISERVFDALASPGSSVPRSVVPRLGSALASMTSPVTLVLDDVHMLHNSECRAAVSVLADHVGGGSRLALAGRDQPLLQVSRLRAEGRILEIGPGELSLTREQAASLLRFAGVVLGADEVTALYQRTEGWPAGLYLAALYLREGGLPPGAAVSFGGDDRLVSEYLKSEFLARLPRGEREFLTRTAVLGQMCGPLCDAVLELPGSAATLDHMARSNLLLVPLDRQGQWYRYHHLFRDMLRAELERSEPGLMPVLRRRAAAWYLRSGLPERALEYSIEAGDVDAAAGLVQQLVMPAWWGSRVSTIQRWLGWLEERGAIEGHPMIAAAASLLAALTGRPAEAERWAGVVDRWEQESADRAPDPSTEAWAALLRAVLCRHGARQMRADADEAVRRLAAENIVAPVAQLMQGIARVLCGDLEAADMFLEDAASGAEEAGAHETRATALSYWSLLAMTDGDWDRAAALANQAGTALRRAGIEDGWATPMVCAMQARAALHRGDVPAARRELVRAQRLRPVLTYAAPHLAVQARIELARAHLALTDLAGDRTLMREIDGLLKRRPGLGTLVGEAEALRGRLAKERGSVIPGASALTAAELRLLPMLSTHLQVHEIAAELVLSPHTVKSRMKSVYRKLDATTRHQAVTRAHDLGLLEE